MMEVMALKDTLGGGEEGEGAVLEGGAPNGVGAGMKEQL